MSHWFSCKSGEPKTRINPSTGVKEFYFPDGRFLHCPDSSPETRDLDLNCVTEASVNVEVPWWRDRNLVMGKRTQRSRKIRIINMLTHQEDIIEVIFHNYFLKWINRFHVRRRFMKSKRGTRSSTSMQPAIPGRLSPISPCIWMARLRIMKSLMRQRSTRSLISHLMSGTSHPFLSISMTIWQKLNFYSQLFFVKLFFIQKKKCEG